MLTKAAFVIGEKDGMVVFEHCGTDEVPRNFVMWTPEEARQTAALLLAAADVASGKREGT